jgi:type II secretory pathway component GspD/PulD (secretin)
MFKTWRDKLFGSILHRGGSVDVSSKRKKE